MSVFNTEDLKTEINTILNKSGELMETLDESLGQNQLEKKTIKIPNSALKNSESEFLNETNQSTFVPRPHTLNDFVQRQELTEICNLRSTFALDELEEDEEFWIMDIPRTIDPLQLKGQILQLGDKSKFKIGEENYSAVNKNSKSSFTCIFNTSKSKEFKTVNVKPGGVISIRRKLSGTSKKNFQFEKSEKVPYPKNIKVRHPLFGIQIDDISIEKKC